MELFRKYRLHYLIGSKIVFAFLTWMQFEKFYSEEGKNINLGFAIVGLLLIFFRSGEIIAFIRNKKGAGKG